MFPPLFVMDCCNFTELWSGLPAAWQRSNYRVAAAFSRYMDRITIAIMEGEGTGRSEEKNLSEGKFQSGRAIVCFRNSPASNHGLQSDCLPLALSAMALKPMHVAFVTRATSCSRWSGRSGSATRRREHHET